MKIKINLLNLSISLRTQDEYNLSLQSQIRQKWIDSRFKWNPGDYNDMKFIFLSSSVIWTPKLHIKTETHNLADMGTCEPTRCKITSESVVECLFACHQTLDCDMNVDNWPYDSQLCKMELAPMPSSKDHFEFQKEDADISEISKLIKTSETKTWSLLYVDLNFFPADNTRYFIFTFKRKADMIYLNIIMPKNVLTIFTFILPLMSADHSLRRILCGLNIFLHFNFIDRVWWQIPGGFESCKFAQMMTVRLIISFVVLCESILLNNFLKSDSVKKNSKVLLKLREKSLIRIFMYNPFESVGLDLMKTDDDQGARVLAKFIDRVFFLSIVVLYWIAKNEIFDFDTDDVKSRL